ncbi:MAG TPA: hypothetical protein VFR85_20690 [Anaeromyxobacteraceae bacterium]|nr:hypothetical protein [Anaeromyxobacteraceae bacterium]
MSHIPAEHLSYQAAVAEYWLHLRGAGLMISPLDAEQIHDWERRGLPLAVVCRGLKRGVEEWAVGRPGASPPRSLRAVRFAVEGEWRAYRQGRVGSSPAPQGEAEAARARLVAGHALLAEAARASSGTLRQAYRAALAGLPAEVPGVAAAEAALRAADDRLLAAWLRSLPRPERSALGPRVRLLAGDRPRRARPAAWRQTLRSHLFDAARRAGLTCLRGSV